MQRKWDNIDKMILSSNQDIDLKDDYNDRLLTKLRDNNRVNNYGKKMSAAASLICTGILLIVIYAGSFQYSLISLEWRVKMQLNNLEQNYNSYVMKNILGE
ncbi:MAG TPA: hypothetical protein VIK72_05825 [Clostridiaceae bacterium]